MKLDSARDGFLQTGLVGFGGSAGQLVPGELDHILDSVGSNPFLELALVPGELVEGVGDMLRVVFHGLLHGVDVVPVRPGPFIAGATLVNGEHRVVQSFRGELIVAKEVVVLVGAKQSVVALHLVMD